MEVFKTIYFIIYILVAIVLIVLSLTQSRKDDTGASAAIHEGSSDSFYSKNRSRTEEAIMERRVKVVFALFVALTVGMYFVTSL